MHPRALPRSVPILVSIGVLSAWLSIGSPILAAAPITPTLSPFGGAIAPPITADAQPQTKAGGLTIGIPSGGIGNLIAEPVSSNDSTIRAAKFCFSNGALDDTCVDSWTGIFLELRTNFQTQTPPQQAYQSGASYLKADQNSLQEWALRGTAAVPANGQRSSGLLGLGSSSLQSAVSAGVYGQTILSETARYAILGKAPALAYAGYFRGRLGVSVDGATKVDIGGPATLTGLVNVAGGASVYQSTTQYLTFPITTTLSTIKAIGYSQPAGLILGTDQLVSHPVNVGGNLQVNTHNPLYSISLNGIPITDWGDIVQNPIWGETPPLVGTYLYPATSTTTRDLVHGTQSLATAPFKVEVDAGKARVSVSHAIKYNQYVVGNPEGPYICGDGVCTAGPEQCGTIDVLPICNTDCGVCPCTPPAILTFVTAGIDASARPVVALGPLGNVGSCYQGTKVQRYASTCAAAPAADPNDAAATIYNADDNAFFDYFVSVRTTYCYRIWTHNDVPEYGTVRELEVTVPASAVLTCADGINNSSGPCTSLGENACCYDYFTTAATGCKRVAFNEPTGSGSGECIGITPVSCGNFVCEWAKGETKRNCSDCAVTGCQSDFGLTPVCEQEEQAVDPGEKFYCPGDCMEFGA